MILEKEKFRMKYCSSLIQITIAEIHSPNSKFFNDALITVSYFSQKHGESLENSGIDIIDLINQLFRNGLSQNLITTLIELSRICEGKYK